MVRKLLRLLRPLFFQTFRVLIIHRLINSDVCAFNKDAISGNSHASFDKNYVSNDNLSNKGDLRESVLSTNNVDFLIKNLIVQLKILLLFTPVAKGRNYGDEETSKHNGETFNPGACG
jgi:hypothetical protein